MGSRDLVRLPRPVTLPSLILDFTSCQLFPFASGDY